ncbi:disease resistance protein L6-like [Rhodamnia argentea]|uniref:Disease resistance protein L6-like n=1 Tax=Rhodamnia argentea TaxID=178133 RepID=A0ABM3HAE3_9MYRT|nr:disease resistance protein L6-like [Rhodamnia argentea]
MDLNGCLTLIIILALTVGLVFRQLTKWQRMGDSESTLRTGDASGVENEALRRDSQSTSRTDEGSGDPYDVFLSFRGTDTGKSFADILHRDMVRAGIRVFFADEELKDGGKINVLLKAVRNSRIFVPIFSQHFADSVWCLREVERMVDCLSIPNEKKEIIPIFYDVTPDDVKLKTNLYKENLRKHLENYDSPQVQQWKKALRTVGRIRGREIQGKRQGQEIDSIVEVVSGKLNTGRKIETENLVEDVAQVQAIMKLLDVCSDGVRYVGIHGLGGIGKTTLAKTVYNKLRSHFEGHCFLEDVRASSQPHDGLFNLQKKLLSGFIGSGIIDQIKDVDGGIARIKGVFSKKKVLIVLDDLDEKNQLEKLAGKYDWFRSGSRIIVTTRRREILTTLVELSSEEVLPQPQRIFGYEVKRMALDRASELFCRHAFKRVSAVEGHEPFAEKIALAVGRLPLSIRVIGSYISELNFDLTSPQILEMLLRETLQKLDGYDFDEIRKVLMVSYHGLNKNEKEVFLDIACFFVNEDQTYPVIMWDDCKYGPHSALCVLEQRSLIKVIGKKLWMHDQVRDLGRHIILEGHIPKFSRVWEHDAAVELLKRKQRNENVEALSLTSSDDNHNLVNEELSALPELRFLRAKGSDISGDFKDLLPKLRWLSWQTWQTTFQAENFHLSRLLVLNLSNSNIKDDWDAWSKMKMNKLEVLDLTGCMGLTRTPDLSNFTSLETLILARCVKLTTIDGSIGKLQSLRTFNINGCKALQELPTEFGSLQSLTEIIMPQHYQPFKLPETFGGLHSLSSLILDEHLGISKLPDEIGGLVNLTRLSLCECAGIKKLPSSIGGMKILAELDLSKSGIDELPDSIGFLKKLKVIRVSYTLVTKFPLTIGDVEMLEELHAQKCWKLTDENLEKIGKLSHLRILDMSYTCVSSFPKVLAGLSHLETLEMCSSDPRKVPNLPSSLKRLHMQAPHFPIIPDLSSLVQLDYLELSIVTIPMEEPDKSRMNDPPKEQVNHPLPSSLSTMKFREVTLLPPFSNLKNLLEMSFVEYPMPCFSVSQDLAHLRTLTLRKCRLLEKIPGLALLKNLRWLELNRLESLFEIDDLLELKSLEHFCIAHCKEIESLPNLSSLGKLRHIELEACPKIRMIEGLKGIESLELDKRGCTILERLLDDPESTWLSHRIPTYDVFLSYRGVDTRYSIVEILYKNLLRNKVLVYRDDGIRSHGEGIPRELLAALDDSHIYIPFLSKNFASSTWCLYELVRMVGCKKSDGKRRILPIFYDVEKADVKLESNLYRDALNDHRSLYGDDAEEWGRKLKEWEEALRYVGDMDGYNLKANSLEELIDLVTKVVSEELLDADIKYQRKEKERERNGILFHRIAHCSDGMGRGSSSGCTHQGSRAEN